MPFPPATKEPSFEYEAALDEHVHYPRLRVEIYIDKLVQRSLEANLATVTDSIELLKAEIEKEETLLAKETKQLHDMEKNAKRAESERKRQMKNVRLALALEMMELRLISSFRRNTLYSGTLTVCLRPKTRGLPNSPSQIRKIAGQPFLRYDIIG